MNIPTLIAILTAAAAIGGLLYRIGVKVTGIETGLVTLRKEREEDRQMLDKALDKLTSHTTDITIHIDPKLEARTYLEQADWRRGVDRRLELLLLNKS